MKASHGKKTVRFILSQLGASALVLAVLFMIPISMLLEQQVREGQAADAIASETQVLQEMSGLAETIVRGGAAAGDIRRMKSLAQIACATEPRLVAGLPGSAQRAIASDVDLYTKTALRLRGDGTDATLDRDLVDRQISLMRQLAASERFHLDRTHVQSTWVYAMIGLALAALIMLLGSGWRSLLLASREQTLLRQQVNEAHAGDAQLTRMEELYLIVASSGLEPALQVERALSYARTTLGYEWAIAIEWRDDEEAEVTASVGPDAVSTTGPLADGGFGLEKAVAVESSRAGEPLTFRIDRLPPRLASFAGSTRPFAWRHCLAYTFPGDYALGTPHCALVLGTRHPRAEGITAPNQQFIRLIGTLVSSACRSARHRKRLDDLAFNDPLTGMANREHLKQQLEETIASAAESGRSFAIHYIDLDGFKYVNDADGHEVGDEVLKIAALRMGKVLRAGETLARIGGDEFVVLQSDAASPHEAREVADRLVDQLSRPFAIDGRKHRIGGSIGIAMYPADGRTSTELLRHADAALYNSKRSGKGRASFYVPPSAADADDVVA